MEELLEAILDDDDLLLREQLVEAIGSTHDWKEGGRVLNWKTHVPAYVQERWMSLPPEARAIAYAMAQEQAHNEEWE